MTDDLDLFAPTAHAALPTFSVGTIKHAHNARRTGDSQPPGLDAPSTLSTAASFAANISDNLRPHSLAGPTSGQSRLPAPRSSPHRSALTRRGFVQSSFK